LSDISKLTEHLQHFERLNAKDQQLIHKLDEVLELLENHTMDQETVKTVKNQLNRAFERESNSMERIEEIKQVSLSDIERFSKLDQLENLLNNHHFDSKQIKKARLKEIVQHIIKIIIGFLMITLGFAMIILPAPPYFEMFTIFHFTRDDGVTLMDLISLIIIATGTLIAIRSLLNIKRHE